MKYWSKVWSGVVNALYLTSRGRWCWAKPTGHCFVWRCWSAELHKSLDSGQEWANETDWCTFRCVTWSGFSPSRSNAWSASDPKPLIMEIGWAVVYLPSRPLEQLSSCHFLCSLHMLLCFLSGPVSVVLMGLTTLADLPSALLWFSFWLYARHSGADDTDSKGIKTISAATLSYFSCRGELGGGVRTGWVPNSCSTGSKHPASGRGV